MTVEIAEQYLSCDAATGQLRWTRRHGRGCVGALAGTKARNGYIRIKFLGREYSAHRLIWMMHFGSWPEKALDHINGDKADNRIENLRLATTAQNAWNMKAKTGAASQFRGVCFIHHLNKWRAQLTANKVTHPLGYFAREQDAALAYDAKARIVYGAFARLNFPTLIAKSLP